MAAALSESALDQNGPNDHLGQNDLIQNRILAFARPNWTKTVHFGPFWPEEVHSGPFRSANRTLAIPESGSVDRGTIAATLFAARFLEFVCESHAVWSRVTILAAP